MSQYELTTTGRVTFWKMASKHWVLVMVFQSYEMLKSIALLGTLSKFVSVVILFIQYFESSYGSYPGVNLHVDSALLMIQRS